MKTVQANTIEKHFVALQIEDGERLFLRGTSTNPWLKIFVIPSCIFFYILGAGLNSVINPDAWGLLQVPAILGGVFGFILPITILNRKEVIITFSHKGLGVGKNLYLWDKFGEFSSNDNYETSNSGHGVRASTSLSFSYGLDRINLRVGWFNKAVALAILAELNTRARKYSPSA